MKQAGANVRTGRRVGQHVAGSPHCPVTSAVVNPLDGIRRLLDHSSDPANPGAAELEALLHAVPRIAVVGLSRDPGKAARRVPSYLAMKGYDVVPVNPNAERILARTSYPTLTEVPGEVGLVLVFRPSSDAGDIVQEALRRPEKPAIWLQTGIRADADIDEARAAGVMAVQDLCIFQVRRLLGG